MVSCWLRQDDASNMLAHGRASHGVLTALAGSAGGARLHPAIRACSARRARRHAHHGIRARRALDARYGRGERRGARLASATRAGARSLWCGESRGVSDFGAAFRRRRRI